MAALGLEKGVVNPGPGVRMRTMKTFFSHYLLAVSCQRCDVGQGHKPDLPGDAPYPCFFPSGWDGRSQGSISPKPLPEALRSTWSPFLTPLVFQQCQMSPVWNEI